MNGRLVAASVAAGVLTTAMAAVAVHTLVPSEHGHAAALPPSVDSAEVAAPTDTIVIVLEDGSVTTTTVLTVTPPQGGAAQPGAPGGGTRTPTANAGQPGATAPTTAASPTTAAPATNPPATAAPTTVPATAAPTTAAPQTTLPPGARIPDDWPAGTPIPPIPPGCKEPVLEDDGVWNCQH